MVACVVYSIVVFTFLFRRKNKTHLVEICFVNLLKPEAGTYSRILLTRSLLLLARCWAQFTISKFQCSLIPFILSYVHPNSYEEIQRNTKNYLYVEETSTTDQTHITPNKFCSCATCPNSPERLVLASSANALLLPGTRTSQTWTLLMKLTRSPVIEPSMKRRSICIMLFKVMFLTKIQ